MFGHTNDIKPFTEAAIFTPSSKLEPVKLSHDTGHFGIHGGVDVRTNVGTYGTERTPRQNECAGLSHARIVSTREGLVPIKFAIETTARQNGGNLNSLCLFSFCDDKDNTTLIRFKF